MTDTDRPSADELERLYWDEELSTWMLAERFDVSQPTIYRWFTEEDIPHRDKSEAATIRNRREREAEREDGELDYTDPDVLRRLYRGKRMTIAAIADRFDRSLGTIWYWLDKHDLTNTDND